MERERERMIDKSMVIEYFRVWGYEIDNPDTFFKDLEEKLGIILNQARERARLRRKEKGICTSDLGGIYVEKAE